MPNREEEELYQEHILDHYEDPYHRGHVAQPTHQHEDDNPLCGDVVRIGGLEATPLALETLELIFGGPMPWIADFF